MTVKTIEIRGANACETFSKTRVGCRGIVVADGRLLVSHERKADCYFIPGGGLEEGETPEECCIRELREETGYIVKPLCHFLTMEEYYEEARYVSHYFICEIAGKTVQHLTAEEVKRGLVPEWVELDQMLEIYSRHRAYAATDEEKRGIYLREYTALTEYFKTDETKGIF